MVDAYGSLRWSSTEHILIYHVNTHFNKIPQLAMHCNVKRDGGVISQRNGEGLNQQMSGE